MADRFPAPMRSEARNALVYGGLMGAVALTGTLAYTALYPSAGVGAATASRTVSVSPGTVSRTGSTPGRRRVPAPGPPRTAASDLLGETRPRNGRSGARAGARQAANSPVTGGAMCEPSQAHPVAWWNGEVLPLDHLLVLDLTAFRSGPTAVRQLADWGARVITIERPATDAAGGALGARLGSDFQNLRRNNESLTLDLKAPEGKAVFLQLVERADVVVENFAPGVTVRLGLDWDALRQVNPGLVYGSISGFGQDGPWARRPGYDQVAQGMSGLMSVTGLPGQGPVRSGHAVADSSSGIYLSFGILAAIIRRERTGEGAWVRTSLLEALVAMMDFQAARVLIEGDVPGQQGNHHPVAVPMGTFPASDGVFNLAPGTNAHFGAVCRVLGHPEWADDERFAKPGGRARNRAEVNRMISEVTSTKPAGEWIEAFVAEGVPAGPVLDLGEMWAHPQVQALGLAQPIEHPTRGAVAVVGQPITFGDDPENRGVRRPAPTLGEQTDDILAELGYDTTQIDALRTAGVI